MVPAKTTDGQAVTAMVSIEDAAWETRVADPEALCAAAAAAAFEAAPAEARIAGEVSIALADDVLLHDLNRRWRGIDKPTNVLAFAALDDAPEGGIGAAHPGGTMLGDIAIARETVEREADEACKSVADHLSHMVVHGMLHLLGFDHQTAAEADEMEAIEVRALASLGIADPYDDVDMSAAPAAQER